MIKITDDKKGKWQSVTASITIDNNMINEQVDGYGANADQAVESLRANLAARAEEYHRALAAMPAPLVPTLYDRADGVEGHFCVGRKTTSGVHEYWDGSGWASAGKVYTAEVIAKSLIGS